MVAEVSQKVMDAHVQGSVAFRHGGIKEFRRKNDAVAQTPYPTAPRQSLNIRLPEGFAPLAALSTLRPASRAFYKTERLLVTHIAQQTCSDPSITREFCRIMTVDFLSWSRQADSLYDHLI